ncbi:hypothetical protein IGI04_002422, partial [Brassica rapa subsp. trilocularis]
NISAKFDAYDFDRNRPVMDEKTLDNVVKAVVQQSLKVLGERKIPDNDAKLSSACVEKSLSVTSSPRRRSPPEKSDKSPVVEPQAQEEKSVKTPVTEPRQQKKPVKSPEPPQQKEKAVKSPVPPQRKEKAVKSPVPAQQKQQKSVKSPALAETPAKKNSELEKDTVVRRILGDDFNEIDFISVSPAKITKDAKDGKDANVPAYGRGLRGKAKRTVTVKDEAIEDKKKAQRAEAALKRKEKQEAKKKENEEKKQKRKAAELQKKQEAGLQKKKKEDEAELPKKKKEKEAELPKKKKEEEAELQRSAECVVTNDEKMSSSLYVSGNTYFHRRHVERGTPKHCWCGEPAELCTSASRANPGRLYYCCRKGYIKRHLFKWADECLVEEVEDMKSVMSDMTKGISDLRVDVGRLEKELGKAEKMKCLMFPVVMDLQCGIPRTCDCGAATIVLTSGTIKNPGRRFYRCGANSGQNHVFKWLDEAHDEEFVVVANKLATIEQDLAAIKAELDDMKKDIIEIIRIIECLRMKS